jgi:hypothetical protein
MPSRDEHLEKADSSAAVSELLVEQQASREWAVTVLFYRAVHVVEAWFALRSTHHQSHVQRSRAVYRELPDIATDYADLLDASRTARYEPNGLLTAADLDRLTDGLERIESRVRADLR